jgi:hypothetical protein
MTPPGKKHWLFVAVKICIMLSVPLFLGACSEGLFSTPIGKVKTSPRDFDGKQITVKGTVTESANLIFVKYFVLRDGTGEIPVVTVRTLPRQGEIIAVKGNVQEAFAVGDQRLIVIVESAQ